MNKTSLQDQYAAKSICFGCGPANKKGLQIKSFVEGHEIVARWSPEPHHAAFPGVLNGGIIGALLDCHMNWTAAHHLMLKNNLSEAPCTVTAEYSIKLRKPTAISEVVLRAHVIQSDSDRAVIEGNLSSGGIVTATCRGIFVAVKSDHPAFHRW